MLGRALAALFVYLEIGDCDVGFLRGVEGEECDEGGEEGVADADEVHIGRKPRGGVLGKGR